jgi:hypothetical protein
MYPLEDMSEQTLFLKFNFFQDFMWKKQCGKKAADELLQSQI